MPHKGNAFAKFAGKYLSEAMKRASKAYKPGLRPRKALIKGMQEKRDNLNREIKKEKNRGRGK